MNRLKDLIQICPSKGKTNEMTITRNALITRVSMIGAALTLTACLAAPLSADNFFFETGRPNTQQPVLGALSRRPSPGNIETETADDFLLQETTVIKSATITGLLPTGTPLGSIKDVEVEVYHIFPADSDVGRTSGSPNFSTPGVPTRNNSPSDVEIDTATRDRLAGTLSILPRIMSAAFTANLTVVNVDRFSMGAGSAGPITGEEVEIAITFTNPIILPSGHYFFRPEVLLTSGDFLYLSGLRPASTPFLPDLQAWIRSSGTGASKLAPDWLRIGTDIIGGTTFNMAFSLSGETIPEAGTPGQSNCHGQSISALAHQFGSINAAASALGFSAVSALQNGFALFCE